MYNLFWVKFLLKECFMAKVLVIILMLTGFVFSGCNSSSKKLENDLEVSDETTDMATDENTNETLDEAVDEETDETVDEINDSDIVEPQQLQTGGMVIFDSDLFSYPDEFRGHTMLGHGGFFGYSIFSFNENYWAVGALHESIPPYDFEKATGRLYIFKKGQMPESIESAELTLTHPDLTYNAGFSFTAAGICDINNDGMDDIVVSSHLASYGDLYAAGEIVVFYGTASGWNEENTSISRISDGLIQKADSMSQSLVCGDIDGDGFADVLAGGQNAGPDLVGGGSQGMVAFFKGSAAGLEKNESWILVPEVAQKAQYFGSSMILKDINDDGIKDLIISGWGLKESDESDNTGGVYVYHGGADWQTGPALKVFGKKDSQFGSVIKLVKVEDKTLLGVISPNDVTNGAIYFYDPETMTEVMKVTVPKSLGMGSEGSFSDFDTLNDSGGETLLVAGGKHFKDYGRILCAKIMPESVSELEECTWQPEETTGGFGSSVKNVGNIDATPGDELIVGMPEYIWTVTK